MQFMEREQGKKPSVREIFAARVSHRKRYLPASTEIPGVSIRREPAVQVSSDTATVWRLLSLAQRLFQIKGESADLEIKKVDAEKDVVTIVRANEGLLGVQSEPHNVGLSAFPSTNYDIEKLRESLGADFSTYVEETVVAEFHPTALANARGPFEQPRLENLLIRAFGHRGVSEKQLKGGMHVETKYKVHTDTLERAVADGKATLVDGAVTIGETYTIKVDPLHKTHPTEPQN